MGAYAKDKSLTDEAGFMKVQVLTSTEIPSKTHYAIGVAREGEETTAFLLSSGGRISFL